jgi:hypothetical protein
VLGDDEDAAWLRRNLLLSMLLLLFLPLFMLLVRTIAICTKTYVKAMKSIGI